MLISPPPPRINVNDFDLVLDGNSLVAFMTQSGNSSAYATLGGGGRTKQNFGVSAQTTSDMLADAVSQIDSQYAPSKILIAWEVRNDIYFGASAEIAVARLRQYCLARRTVGYRILAIGCLPTIATPPSYSVQDFYARLTEANRLMRRDWRNYCDGWVDPDAIQGLQNPSDLAAYFDGVHLTPSGYSLLFAAVNAELARLRR
jgi:lysophospholipase L1-like esterase